MGIYEIQYRLCFNEPHVGIDAFDNTLVPEFVYYITKYNAEVKKRNEEIKQKNMENENRIRAIRTKNKNPFK